MNIDKPVVLLLIFFRFRMEESIRELKERESFLHAQVCVFVCMHVYACMYYYVCMYEWAGLGFKDENNASRLSPAAIFCCLFSYRPDCCVLLYPSGVRVTPTAVGCFPLMMFASPLQWAAAVPYGCRYTLKLCTLL